jgi:hypothetical protein
LDFGGPVGDEGGVCAGFESFAVAGEFGVAVVGDLLGGHCGWIEVGIWLGVVEGFDGVGEAVWGGGAQPVVQWWEELAFGEVDVPWMLNPVG